MPFNPFKRAPLPETTTIALARGEVAVRVRASSRARAYRLAISSRGEPVLTVPHKGRWSEARAFLLRHAGWLETRLARLPAPSLLVDGAAIPLRGVPHRIVSLDGSRGTVCVKAGDQGPEIHVPGGPDHLQRRLFDWLKREARADLDLACARHAETLGVTIAALRLRDQSTRWGSCSSARTLNFNWRLILAPPFVLDYVAAHEVAHILEMNHAPAFWRTVARTLPDYEAGRAWLKANGRELMQVGGGSA